MIYKKFLIAVISCFSFVITFSQQGNDIKSLYNPQKIFAQNFFTKNGNEFRSANGAPGPKYWQNRADYTLKASD